MAEGKKTIEEVIANYAASQEGAGVNAPVSKVSPAKKVQDNFAKQAQSAVESRQTLAEAQAEHQQNIKEELIMNLLLLPKYMINQFLINKKFIILNLKLIV